jgi:protein-serine/threonine kinase
MSDLLPPSPSAVSYSSRSFIPSPSTLSSSVTVPDFASQFAGPRPNSPSSPETHINSPPSIPQPYTYSHSRNLSSSLNANASNLALGPPLRPFDYGQVLLSNEGTHAELARTVDDLSKWLSAVEVGLTGLLDKAYEDTIEEEDQEDLVRETHDSENSGSLGVSADVTPSTQGLRTFALVAKP